MINGIFLPRSGKQKREEEPSTIPSYLVAHNTTQHCCCGARKVRLISRRVLVLSRVQRALHRGSSEPLYLLENEERVEGGTSNATQHRGARVWDMKWGGR